VHTKIALRGARDIRAMDGQPIDLTREMPVAKAAEAHGVIALQKPSVQGAKGIASHHTGAAASDSTQQVLWLVTRKSCDAENRASRRCSSSRFGSEWTSTTVQASVCLGEVSRLTTVESDTCSAIRPCVKSLSLLTLSSGSRLGSLSTWSGVRMPVETLRPFCLQAAAQRHDALPCLIALVW
jgi:hypothetical protein